MYINITESLILNAATIPAGAYIQYIDVETQETGAWIIYRQAIQVWYLVVSTKPFFIPGCWSQIAHQLTSSELLLHSPLLTNDCLEPFYEWGNWEPASRDKTFRLGCQLLNACSFSHAAHKQPFIRTWESCGPSWGLQRQHQLTKSELLLCHPLQELYGFRPLIEVRAYGASLQRWAFWLGLPSLGYCFLLFPLCTMRTFITSEWFRDWSCVFHSNCRNKLTSFELTLAFLA